MNLGFVYDLVKHRYTYNGKQVFDPVCMIRALLLIPLGYAESVRDLAERLIYDMRLSYLCGFDKDNNAAHIHSHGRTASPAPKRNKGLAPSCLRAGCHG